MMTEDIHYEVSNAIGQENQENRKARILPPLKNKPLPNIESIEENRILNVKPFSLQPLNPLVDKTVNCEYLTHTVHISLLRL